MRSLFVSVGLLFAGAAGSDGPALREPSLALCGGKPITVDVGHSAPCFTDLDGDGLPDLLVGQFGEGKLRVYRNAGNPGDPKFGAWEYLKAGGKPASVDYG
jgi:hypothetical protein